MATGAFIARKRKELNLTQAQLAERLGISSKSVSKWERGKCMPDYAVANELCDALGITVSELFDGEENERENMRMYDNDQMIEMLVRIQRLESQRVTIIAIALIVIGIGLLTLSPLLGGSDLTVFTSGVLFGIGVGRPSSESSSPRAASSHTWVRRSSLGKRQLTFLHHTRRGRSMAQ